MIFIRMSQQTIQRQLILGICCRNLISVNLLIATVKANDVESQADNIYHANIMQFVPCKE